MVVRDHPPKVAAAACAGPEMPPERHTPQAALREHGVRGGYCMASDQLSKGRSGLGAGGAARVPAVRSGVGHVDQVPAAFHYVPVPHCQMRGVVPVSGVPPICVGGSHEVQGGVPREAGTRGHAGHPRPSLPATSPFVRYGFDV